MSDEVRFDEAQQALVDKLVGEARVKARERAQAELTAQATKDKDAAEQAALMAEKEWEKLTGIAQAEVKRLGPFEAKAKALDELVEGMLKDKIKAMGEAAKTAVKALPKTMSAIDKLNWLNQNEALFQATGDGVGTPGRPKTKSGGKKKEAWGVGGKPRI